MFVLLQLTYFTQHNSLYILDINCLSVLDVETIFFSPPFFSVTFVNGALYND